jgi:hypothetical protein
MKSSLAATHGYTKPLEVSQIELLRDAVLASRRTMCPGCPSCDTKVASTSYAFRDIARYVTYFEQDNRQESRERYLNLPAEARHFSTAELQAISKECAFGVDYVEVANRAERYFA